MTAPLKKGRCSLEGRGHMKASSALNQSSAQIDSEIRGEYADMLDSVLESKIAEEMSGWETGMRKFLSENSPFETSRRRLHRAERSLKRGEASIELVGGDLEGVLALSPGHDTSSWMKKCEGSTSGDVRKDNPITGLLAVRGDVQGTWRKIYEQKLLNWQLERIEEEREKLVGRLREWLDMIRSINESLDVLGIEPGVLWDNSAGSLSSQDVAFLKEWTKYLKDDDNIRRLCDLIGRMRSDSESSIEEQVIVSTAIETTVPDVSSREEIVGLEFGRMLEDMLPQELSLLGDTDMSVLFDLRFVENRLMCFSKQGYVSIEEQYENEETVSSDDTEKGPLIICVDTSGSMAGAPENIAKALTLSLASKAVSQKRNCYLINFSTSIHTTDLTPPKGFKDLIEFLKLSFHGGTDASPALIHSIEMTKNGYEKADVLVISDFVMSGLDSKITHKMEESRNNKCKFYALSIGSFGRGYADAVFDSQWTYDPSSSSITQLNLIKKEIRGAI
jgi:uncharacterized protein with von Willebrand factor type A (vWA) domain